MNRLHLVCFLFTLLFLAGCGKKDAAAGGAAAASSPPPAPSAGPKTFEITANDQMKFSVTRLEVSPGDEVRVVLTNIGAMPKEVMAHDWVLLKKEADPQAYANAAMTQMKNEYFPPQFADQVIAHTKLLGPKQSDEVVFKAPTEPGEYPYLCSFPAHFISGMKGVLVVR